MYLDWISKQVKVSQQTQFSDVPYFCNINYLWKTTRYSNVKTGTWIVDNTCKCFKLYCFEITSKWLSPCGCFKKYLYPPPLEILRGRGVSIAKILKRRYEAKLEIPGGGGERRQGGEEGRRAQSKEPSLGGGGMDNFLEPHIIDDEPGKGLMIVFD